MISIRHAKAANPAFAKPARSVLMTGVALAALCLGAPQAGAQQVTLPTGGSVAAGSAVIGAPSGNSMTINQSSQSAIINWNTFSIGNGGSVAFNNGNGATLNRVLGNVPSQLDGSLTATGSLYLVNPAGVVVGTTGRISTGGSFVASTQNVSDADFLAGKAMTFSGGSQATVVNYGKIGSLGGDVALIARKVENHGSMTAPNGTVALAAGYEVLMRDATLSDGKFLVKVGGSDTAAGTTGTIRAANVELKANGGSVYALAGNTRGITKATGLNASGGKIIFTAGATGKVTVTQKLVAQRKVVTADGKRVRAGGDVRIAGGEVTLDGEIDAKGNKAAGGSIVATGDHVTLTKNARLDASGSSGGIILVGGDRLGGSDPAQKFLAEQVATAKTTTVAQGAKLIADGRSGNGGNVVIWSDQHTIYDGAISARGGSAAGNGGFAEVSSHGLLDFRGTADLRAPKGSAGTLLLDPYNVVISDGSNSGGGLGSDPTSTSVINIDTLTAALASGNVIVTTGGAGSAGSEAGDITVANAFAWTSGNSLTLSAYRDINVNANIGSGAGAVILRADNSGSSTGTVNFGAGVKVVNTTGRVSIYYNPNNPAGTTPGTVNATQYTTPTNYSGNVQTASGLTAAMLVNNIYDLQNINNNTSGNFALGADIDASATVGWNNGAGFNPITTLAAGGLLDGLGHVIFNLTIVDSTQFSTGLFSSVAGTIKNLGLSNANVSYVGPGSGGSVGSLAGASTGTISNVFSENATVVALLKQSVGGLIGTVGSGSITSSYSSGTVSGSNGSTGFAIGGLIGLVNGNANISSSYSAANVGLTGTATTAHMGGLVGSVSGANAQLSDTYATGTVSASGYAGSGATSIRTGGLVGTFSGSGAKILRSYATGQVIGATGAQARKGGLIGATTLTVGFTSNYWNTETSGLAFFANMPGNGSAGTNTTNPGVTGLTTAQMYDPANYAGWNFTTVWAPPTTNGQDSNGATGLSYMPGLYGVSHILAVNPGNTTVTYTGTAPVLKPATYAGLQGGDSIGTPASLTSNVTAPYNAGSYSVSVSGNPTVNSAYTYRIINNTGTLTINPVQVTVDVTYSIANASSTYGTLATLGAVTLNGVLSQDQANVGGVVGLKDSSGNIINLTALTNAGSYTEYLTGLTGSAAGNYQIAATGNTTGTLTINKATLNVASGGSVAGSKVYDGSTAAAVTGNGTLGGTIYGADAANLGLALTAAYADKNAGGGKSVTGSYALTGSAARNYQLATNTFAGTADITPATLTIGTTGAVASKTYDGTTAATAATNGTLGGVIGGDAVTLSLGGLSFAGKNAGTGIAVSGSYGLGGADAGNYVLASNVFSGTADINKATLTIATAGSIADKTYDGLTTATVAGNGTLGGVFGGDAVTLSLGGTSFADKNAGTGKSVTGSYSLGGADAGNYQLASSAFSGTASINKASLTIVNAGTVANKVYDGSTNATLSGATFSGSVAGDNVTLAVSGGFASKNVGSNIAVNGSYSLGGSDAGNYLLSGGGSFSGTASITPATLTIATAGSVASKTYDGTTAASVTGNGTLGGVIGGDAVTLSLGGTSFATKNAGTGIAVSGTYGLGGADAGNYVLASTAFNATADIGKATLSIATAGSIADKTYDGLTAATAASNGTLGGVIGGDAVTLALGGASFADKNAGAGKAVTGSYSLGGADAGNYQLASSAFSGTASINKAALTIVNAGTAANKVYDGTTNATLSGATFSGTVAGDNVTLAVAGGFASKNVGSNIAVNGTYSLGGSDAGNYLLSGGGSFSGTANITPATLTITTAGSAASKTYDGLTSANAASNGTLGGVIAGDAVTLSLGGLSFASKSAGTGKTVTGSYALGGAAAGNYVLASNVFSGTADINKATLTIATAGSIADKTYDGLTAATAASNGTLGGVIGGDAVTLSLGNASFVNKNAGTGKSVSGSYSLGGADAGNYQLASTAFSGAATINKASLTIVNAGTVADKVYDGTTSATISGATFAGVIGGDQVVLGLTGGFASRNVGSNIAVNGSYSLGGADAGNYLLAGGNSFTGSASITPATLTLNAVAGSKTYDGTTASSGTVSHGGLVGGDTISGLAQAFDSKNAGSRTLSVQGGYTVNDGNGGRNYTVVTNTASGTINAATLTYVANPAAGNVGGPLPSLGGTVSGFVNGENLASATTGTLAWSTAASGSSPAGSYAITGTGLTANDDNYVFVQAAGNATALTITAPQTGPTPQDIAANAGTLNPIVMEPGSSNSNTTTGGTNSGTSYWSWTGTSPDGGSPQGTGQGTGQGGSSNDPGAVYPDNTRFGQWLSFVSR